jgi:16S rRNA G966 N2-methylase RsmD
MDFDVEFDDGRKVIVEIKPADFYDEEKLERQRDSASSLGYEFYTLTQFQLTEMAQDLDFGADDFDLFACNPTFWRNLEDEKQKQQIVARTVSSLAGRSFPYPSFSEETLHKDWDTLAPAQGKTEDEQFHLVENGKGNRIIYHFQPEIWHTRCMAPRSGVAYDYYMENLPKLVENRFIYADQMTEASLRRGLRFLVSTPTSMSPALAWACYLLSDKSSLEGLSILDPCAGWGGRFLAATKAGAHYTGFDPNDRAIAGINQMAEFLELRRPNIGNIPFEDAGLGDSKFDIAFTSPPYYRKELYHGSNQSHERYKTYTEWLEGFLKVLIRKSTEALKPGGVLILNLGDYLNCNIQQDTKQYLSTLGRVDRVPLRYRRMFNKKGNLLTRDESIFILKV